MPVYKENKPTADVLMNSMRAMGYSFESAIADVIDNSISAKANRIDIKFPKDPLEDCFVAICDNGYGMTQSELFDAMKYGSELKREGRDDNDLGRFGLGLKSASLSQCRKLTVASKKDGKISAYIWDLDTIEEKKDWYIIECTEEMIDSIKCINYFEHIDSGTIVLWEDFDLIKKSSGNVYTELCRECDETANYLSLIFHRFLNRTGTNKVVIKVNEFELTGLDPFLENHNKTNFRKEIKLPIEDSNGVERMVIAQPYILPYQNDLSKEDIALCGGTSKSKQGFYVYRNERLIIWGNWFGRQKDELTRNARIRVDIPNTLDDIWGIDIKKQNAKIPAKIKNRLTRAVDEAMDISVKAQKYRGRKEVVDEKIDYIWYPFKLRDGSIVYQINRTSSIFDLLKDELTDAQSKKLDLLLDEIENSIPYQQIYIDKAQDKINENNTDESRNDDVIDLAEQLIELRLSFGLQTRNEIIEDLFNSEPFVNHVELKQNLLEK